MYMYMYWLNEFELAHSTFETTDNMSAPCIKLCCLLVHVQFMYNSHYVHVCLYDVVTHTLTEFDIPYLSHGYVHKVHS